MTAYEFQKFNLRRGTLDFANLARELGKHSKIEFSLENSILESGYENDQGFFVQHVVTTKSKAKAKVKSKPKSKSGLVPGTSEITK